MTLTQLLAAEAFLAAWFEGWDQPEPSEPAEEPEVDQHEEPTWW